ncbi:MAG: VPLPA-CTERM sorting domain-containing protein [Desulfobulbaceae bacterium]|nr:VPLPA-CTERM sorting domain-containing protein [Desulfobulbaceae bacterium]
MRKVFSTAVMAAMVFGSVSLANAAITDYYNDLQRIVYNPTQIEIISSIANAPDPGAGALVPGAFGLDKFQEGTTWADLEVAYWGLNDVTTQSGLVTKHTYDVFFSSSHASFTSATPVADFINTNQFSQYLSGFNSITGLLTGETTQLLPSNPNSYTEKFETDGQLASLLRLGNSAEVNLASFDADGSQYIDQYVYQLHRNDAGVWSFVTEDTTDYIYAIRTLEDGSSQVVAPTAAVPVPGAVWLLGSGLMGLAGLRRKNANKPL